MVGKKMIRKYIKSSEGWLTSMLEIKQFTKNKSSASIIDWTRQAEINGHPAISDRRFK